EHSMTSLSRVGRRTIEPGRAGGCSANKILCPWPIVPQRIQTKPKGRRECPGERDITLRSFHRWRATKIHWTTVSQGATILVTQNAASVPRRLCSWLRRAEPTLQKYPGEGIVMITKASRRALLKSTAGSALFAAIGAPAIVKAQADVIRIGHLTPLTGFLGPL